MLIAEDSFEETILYYSLFKHELKCLAAFNVAYMKYEEIDNCRSNAYMQC